MHILKRFLALYLGLTALAVFFNLILTPVYHDGSPEYPVWEIMNHFMAAGVLLALGMGFLRRRAASAPDTPATESIWATVFCYATIALAMLFFWEWFWNFNPDSETGEAVTSHIIYFPIVDALYTIVALDAARYLWKKARGT